MSRLIATYFYIGHIPFAPGTWGSLAALPLIYVLHALTGFPGLMIATIGLFALGWWATADLTRGAADHDPSFVVMDEVVGQMIALWPVSVIAWISGEKHIPYQTLLIAFVLFRIFDIWKPWLVGWADRRGDALGVMLDDVIAGLFAAIIGMALVAAYVYWKVITHYGPGP